MAHFAFKGAEEYALKLSKLADSREIAGKAIYAAADIVADAVRRNIDGIPVQNGFVKDGETRTGIPQLAKIGLQNSFGITPMEQDAQGFLNVKLGFDGYNRIQTKAHPGGQPNQMIARAVESGTSFMPPRPFIRPAVRKTKQAAVAKMQEVIDEETKKIMG